MNIKQISVDDFMTENILLVGINPDRDIKDKNISKEDILNPNIFNSDEIMRRGLQEWHMPEGVKGTDISHIIVCATGCGANIILGAFKCIDEPYVNGTLYAWTDLNNSNETVDGNPKVEPITKLDNNSLDNNTVITGMRKKDGTLAKIPFNQGNTHIINKR